MVVVMMMMMMKVLTSSRMRGRGLVMKLTDEELAKLKPMSAFSIRNRYLSRLGAQVRTCTHTPGTHIHQVRTDTR